MSKCSRLFAALLVAGSAPVAAQPVRVGDPIFEITVVAPRLVRQQVGPTSNRTENVSLTRRVDYSDLNLKLHADVMELEERVNDVAKQACAQLAAVFPLSDRKSPDCVKEAIGKAMTQVHAAVAAANR
jgi:UrcA family protein